MTQDKLNQYLASARPIIAFFSGVMAMWGFQTVITPQDLVTDFDHIFNGIKEFWLGAGPLLAAVMLLWSKHKASLASQVATVKTAEPASLVQAVQQVAPATLRDAVAAQPEVKQVVVTTQAVANASPSAKVTT
jgi:hypothetical protein